MKELSKEYKVPFVINDNIEVALAVDADGVHIGQDDMSVEEASQLFCIFFNVLCSKDR